MAIRMSRPAVITLASRHLGVTRGAILEAAVDMVQEGAVADITMRAVAARAGMSERTVFRHFASREELLAGLIEEVSARFDLPTDPGTIEQLLAYPAALYGRFEATSALTRAALRSELFDRFRSTNAQRRWQAIGTIIDRAAKGAPVRARRIAAANIRYHLSASAWNYYRFYFGFPLDEAVECADTAIVQALQGVGALPRKERGR